MAAIRPPGTTPHASPSGGFGFDNSTYRGNRGSLKSVPVNYLLGFNGL